MSSSDAGPHDDLVAIGRVGRPHGIQGAFFVEHASEAPERFEPGASLLLAGRPACVAERKRSGGRLVIRLDVPAERGAPLQMRRSELPPPAPDAHYVFQLRGLRVEEEGGRSLGFVTDVAPGPANDVLELDTGLALPLVEDCVREVDLDGRRILIARGFADPLEA